MNEWTDVHLFASTHSGSTYLLNMFLELGIAIYREDASRFWSAQSDGSYRLRSDEQLDLGVWFPRFQTQVEYRFSSRTRVQWAHYLPRPHEYARKLILVVRHPHDFLWSFYKRVGEGISFTSFLRRPVGPDVQGVFSLPASEEWGLYNRILQDLPSDGNLCLVRFEDLKARPLEELQRVMAFLGESRPDAELRESIERSDFRTVKQAADRWYEQHPVLQKGEWRAMRRGQVGESRQSVPPETWAALSGAMNPTGHSLWYFPPVDSPRNDFLEEAARRAEGLSLLETETALREHPAGGSTTEDRKDLGRALACCSWVRENYESPSLSVRESGRLLASLLRRSAALRDGPLVGAAEARALARSGHTIAAVRLLTRLRDSGPLEYAEKAEIGLGFLACGDAGTAGELLSDAASCPAMEGDLEHLSLRLLRAGAWGLSKRSLKRDGTLRWATLALRDLARRARRMLLK